MIETPLRPQIALENGWEFSREKVGRSWLGGHQSGGEKVVLPHCWNATDTFQYGRMSASGRGAYRRRTCLPPQHGELPWQLRLGGFYGIGEVWFDGRRLARVDGQYLGAVVALPPAHRCEEHVVGVRLDNRWRRHILPGFKRPDFVLYGGLAGGAWLEGLPANRFAVDRIRVDCAQQDSGAEKVTIEWALAKTAAAPGDAAVEWILTDAEDNVIGAAPSRPVPPGAGQQSTSVEILYPRCWAPDDPFLYWAEGRLLVEDTVVDVVRVRFGVTRAEFRPRRGFFLDGVRVDLHGCNRHEAIPGFGSALPDELHVRDARILKDLGCNFVRLSHYPQSPVFLDACDELGLLVYAEIATWKSVRSAGGWRRAARRQMRDLVVRDRHHPCVAVWGMGNESRSRKAYLELRAIAGELDPRRPVSYAENHLYRARRERTVGIPDVWGVNYELDVLEEACSSSRLENVVVSECCNHAESIRGQDDRELVQLAVIEREWERMADLPFVAGHAVWCFSDYATEHRSRFRRLPGLFDAWRWPKMAAELFRARYSKRPFVSLHITEPGPHSPPNRFRAEHRVDGDGRAPLELHAFTNCETLRVARDGSMLAVLEGAIHHVFPLFGSFEEIIATGSRDGTVVQDRVRSHGEARRIHLRTAVGSSHPTVELDVEIHDDSSTVVRSWNGAIRMTVDGPGRCHTFNDDREVQLARGVGRAYVSIDGDHEAVVVTAAADGLSPAFLSLHGSVHGRPSDQSSLDRKPGPEESE